MNVLGIDVGGTKIFVGRYNYNLELEAETKVPTEADKGKEVTLKNLVQAINKVKNSDTQGLGISWAGFVDSKTGTVVKAPNVPNLNGFALCDYLAKETGLPTKLENDARAFAYGAWAQVAPQSKMCVGLIVGTGVGSGLVLEGKIITGAHGYAGEIGHINLQGQEVETWLAGPGLKEHLAVPADINFSDLLPEKKEELNKKIEQQLSVWGQWLSGIALGFDPDHIIVGGGTGIYFWQHYKAEIEASAAQALKGYPNEFQLHFHDSSNAGAEGAAQIMFDYLNAS